MSTADMIEPDEWSKNLQRTVLVVWDECSVGYVIAGHHLGAGDVCLTISSCLHDDGLHGPIWARLGRKPFGEVERRLQAFVLEVSTIDERADLFFAPYGKHLAERFQVREARRVIDRGRDGHVSAHQGVEVARPPGTAKASRCHACPVQR